MATQSLGVKHRNSTGAAQEQKQVQKQVQASLGYSPANPEVNRSRPPHLHPPRSPSPIQTSFVKKICKFSVTKNTFCGANVNLKKAHEDKRFLK
jgi:hypothetical protein